MPSFRYPADLAERITAEWPPALGPDPLASHRPALLELAYQVSMARDEGRPVRLRILLVGRDDAALARDLHLLPLEPSRACSVDELRRIAAATPFETAMVCVAPEEDGDLRIWGIAWSGAEWLAPTWGGRTGGGSSVPRTVVHASGPGRIAAYAGERFLASLEHGEIVTVTTDVFASTWLGALFAEVRAEILALHDRDRDAGSATLDESVVRTIGQSVFRRTLWLMRSAGHGGMILFAEPDDVDALLAGPLRAKYRFAPGEPRERYRTLLMRITSAMARARAGAVTAEDYLMAREPEVEEDIFEIARLIASLSMVDGAVLLTKRLGIVAFGVEVHVDGTPVTDIRRALDTEGDRCIADAEENVGTRHRAAYRFVHAHPKGLAVVVSQDGTVRFVVRIRTQIKYFEHHLTG